MELEKTYTYRVDTQATGDNRAITISGLQRIIVGVSEEHLENIELDVPRLMKNYGVSWVLLSMTAKSISPIVYGEKLQIRTWHTEKKGVYYRREIEICHEDGSPAAVAATFSSILDMNTRRICKDDEIIAKVLDLGEGKKLLEAQSRIHINPKDLDYVKTEDVRPSQIDALGHVNNSRYGEIITDALTPHQLEELHNLIEYEIAFTGELRLGDSVEVRISENEHEILAAGIRKSDGKAAFTARLRFENPFPENTVTEYLE